MSHDRFTKDNLDGYLMKLANEYKRLGGKFQPIEIVIVGGASILCNYEFRDSTTDIDAITPHSSILKKLF